MSWVTLITSAIAVLGKLIDWAKDKNALKGKDDENVAKGLLELFKKLDTAEIIDRQIADLGPDDVDRLLRDAGYYKGQSPAGTDNKTGNG